MQNLAYIFDLVAFDAMFRNKATKSKQGPQTDDCPCAASLHFVSKTWCQTYYFTCLFTALSSSACTNDEFTKLRNCWTFGIIAFNRVQLIAQSMESASSRLRTGQRSSFWAPTIIC